MEREPVPDGFARCAYCKRSARFVTLRGVVCCDHAVITSITNSPLAPSSPIPIHVNWDDRPKGWQEPLRNGDFLGT